MREILHDLTHTMLRLQGTLSPRLLVHIRSSRTSAMNQSTWTLWELDRGSCHVGSASSAGSATSSSHPPPTLPFLWQVLYSLHAQIHLLSVCICVYVLCTHNMAYLLLFEGAARNKKTHPFALFNPPKKPAVPSLKINAHQKAQSPLFPYMSHYLSISVTVKGLTRGQGFGLTDSTARSQASLFLWC